MSQPHLIQQILQDLNLEQPIGATTNTSKYTPKSLDTPATSTVIMECDPEGERHNEPWHYQSVIGKLNYLKKSSRPDLAYSVHNCAQFSSDPKLTHSQAVKRIGRCLLGTKDKGIIFKPDPTRSLEVFADSDFCGLYNPETAIYDPVTSKSQTGFIIQFMECPIVWASTLQTETILSSCEAEYTSCSESLRSAIPLMHLIKEIKSRGITTTTSKAKVLCKLFCDNQGACELIHLPKIRPRTKHINTKLHHFRYHVANRSITIQYVPTQEQLADIAIKHYQRHYSLSFVLLSSAGNHLTSAEGVWDLSCLRHYISFGSG
jgi:hypothetical protein